MSKRAFLIGAVLLFLFLNVQQTFSQSLSRKAEIGGQFVLLKVSDDPGEQFPAPNDIEDTLVGGGIRFGYNISNSLAIEAEGNIFKRPSDREGRRSQGLFGVKWGKRNEKSGIFAKVRPGFMRFDRSFSFVRSGGNNTQDKTNVYLALDIGAVVEFYTSRRSIIRLDFGDTIVRYTNRQIEGFEPGAIPIVKTNYGHNFQFSVGVGFRF